MTINVNGTRYGIAFEPKNAWTLKNAKAVCRMLGFKDPFYAVSLADETYRIRNHIDGVIDWLDCEGGEKSLLDCRYTVVSGTYEHSKLGRIVCGNGEGKSCKGYFLKMYARGLPSTIFFFYKNCFCKNVWLKNAPNI